MTGENEVWGEPGCGYKAGGEASGSPEAEGPGGDGAGAGDVLKAKRQRLQEKEIKLKGMKCVRVNKAFVRAGKPKSAGMQGRAQAVARRCWCWW